MKGVTHACLAAIRRQLKSELRFKKAILRSIFHSSPSNSAAMDTKTDLDRIRVASPCNARWNDMVGDERARFCGQCSRHVFNLSAMTRPQIEMLVGNTEGKFCGWFYQRPDGRMLTADCPSRLRQLRQRMAGVGGALCALALAVLGCSSRREPETNGQILMGDVAVAPAGGVTNQPPEIMGRIALPEPPPPAATNSRARMGEIHVESKPAPGASEK